MKMRVRFCLLIQSARHMGSSFTRKNSKSRFSKQFGNLTRVLTLTSPTIAHFNKNFKQHTHSREAECWKISSAWKYISFSYHNFPQLNDINTISFEERSECGNINMDCDPARMWPREGGVRRVVNFVLILFDIFEIYECSEKLRVASSIKINMANCCYWLKKIHFRDLVQTLPALTSVTFALSKWCRNFSKSQFNRNIRRTQPTKLDQI